MPDLRSVPVLRALLPFSAGGYLGYGPPGTVTAGSVIPVCLMLWALVIVFFRLSGNGSRSCAWCFAVVCFLLFMAAGYGSGRAAWKDDPMLPEGKRVLVQGILRESPVTRGETLVIDLHARMVHDGLQSRRINTNLKITLRMGAGSVVPAAGETRMFYGTPYPIRNSGNPGDPDFETILHRQNCWYRFYVAALPPGLATTADSLSPEAGVLRPAVAGGPMPPAYRIRKRITDHWAGGPGEIGLLQAVCLGERSGLTDDLRQSYSHAGGMHLLAVSGLHVGLIWWVLRALLSWMRLLPGGDHARAFSVVFLLWSYALVTGFAPPVCRAVLMFTLVTVSRLMDHRARPVNPILVSAFLLLAADPGWITRVGFQLSYGAILGIALLYAPLVRRARPGNRLFAWIWQAVVLSFSAQLATAPLVIYYFHQFPLYSLLTSLVAIPLLSCLIALFVLSMPLVATGIFPGFLNFCMMELAGWMNRVMEVVSSMPGAVAGDLYMDRAGCVFFMALTGLVISAVVRWRASIITGFLLVMVLILYDGAGKTCRLIHSSELVVAHFNGGSLVSIREGVRADHYVYAADSMTFAWMQEYLDRTWRRDRLRNHLYRLHDTASVAGSVTSSRKIARGISLIGNDRLSLMVVSGTAGDDHGEVPSWSALCNRAGSCALRCDRTPDFILLCNGAASFEPAGPVLCSAGEGAGETGTPDPPGEPLLIVDGSNPRHRVAPCYTTAGNVHLTRNRGALSLRW